MKHLKIPTWYANFIKLCLVSNKHSELGLKLYGTLMRFGFTSPVSDRSLLVRINVGYTIYLLEYVDDILITGNDPLIVDNFVHDLNTEFALKDLGEVSYFLGIQVSSLSDGGYLLSQRKYIANLLSKARMSNAKGVDTPMTSGQRLTTHVSELVKDIQFYRSIVGALQYITIIEPDLTSSVNKVCQFIQNPLETHWQAVKRILRYLAGTLDT